MKIYIQTLLLNNKFYIIILVKNNYIKFNKNINIRFKKKIKNID